MLIYLIFQPFLRVLEEIEEVVGDKPSVEADDLDKLIYMKQVHNCCNDVMIN